MSRDSFGAFQGSAALEPHAAAGQDAVVGTVPLVANRHSYFLRRRRNLHYWNVHSGILSTHEPIDNSALESAVHALILHHDGLRLRARCSDTGWTQTIVEPSTVGDLVTYLDVGTVTERRVRQLVEENTRRLQESFAFPGDLLRLLHVRDARAHLSHLFLVAHHLLVDAYSFGIVLDDLFALYRQTRSHRGLALPPKTTSFSEYSTVTTAFWLRHADREAQYWRSLPWSQVEPLPLDQPIREDSNLERHTIQCIESVPADETAVLHRLPDAWPSRFVDTVLAAVARAYWRWTGSPTVLIANVFHNRACLREDVDVTRTVGWLSEAIPVLLRANLPQAELLEDARQQVARATVHGKGYGVLRYLAPGTDAARLLGRLPEPQISLNVKVPSPRQPAFTDLAQRAHNYRLGPAAIGSTERVFLLSGGAWFGNGRLHLAWDSSGQLFDEATIAHFTRACMTELLRLLDSSARVTAKSRRPPSP